MRIGIDVGGTNTDAVLMDGTDVLAEVKTVTTQDVTAGIAGALRGLVGARDFSPAQIQAIMIGTTHFTQCPRRGQEARPDCCAAARAAGDGRAAAHGRLAGPAAAGHRRTRLPVPRRARVRWPSDLPPGRG